MSCPEDFEPLLMASPNDGHLSPLREYRYAGFLQRVQLDRGGWLPVLVGKPEWRSTILLYGTEEGWDGLEKKQLSLDEHKALANGLADSARKMHAFWLAQRRTQAAAGTGLAVLRR
jgi:uncharacterized protein